jgi:HAD superfamily hydrolase (TIGR01509 family)
MERRFDAMIFDMDGLMIDTERVYWAMNRELASRRGKTVSAETLRKMMGRGAMDSMRIYVTETGIPEDPAVLLAMRETMVLERFREGVRPMPGLREILDAFRGRLKLGIATSAPRKFVEVILPQLGIETWFDVVQTGETVGKGKPDPEIYLAAMSKLGVRSERCVVLEDSRLGAMAGKNAGAYLIAVPDDLMSGEDFSFADFRAGSLDEAREHVEGLLEGEVGMEGEAMKDER